ncbi:hypothetical protein [Sphingomonas sp.]|uniref:hypothetical protein n=1 Tax=Sphingomonas sp. TaxID=28214 RepID=UPI002DD68A7E|nr:hypothetical protein [Sphingomonas sp.]
MIGNPTRRHLLGGALTLPASAALAATPDGPDASRSIAADLDRYIGFGVKQSGGAGDTACGDWLDAELRAAGFAVERQPISVPWFAPERCELIAGPARAPVWPQPIVVPTPRDGLTARLVRVAPDGTSATPPAGAIALVELPFARWSSVLTKAARSPIDAAFAGGARAVVAVTHGPTGGMIALNTDGRKPLFPGPLALLAPNDAAPLLAAASRGETATLHLSGRGGRRTAFNLVGRIDRGIGTWLVVSTPRSGWFTCAGERGGGIAAWLALMRWAGKALPGLDLAFICNSGHEYEHLGAEEMLRAVAPPPAATRFWLHLGANLAARDWHEGIGAPRPLPSADPQRYLSVSRALLPAARRVFAGRAGLEAPYASDTLSAGELNNIIAAGYPMVAGVFGLHRYHHVAEDDARCIDAEEVARTAAAFRALLVDAVKPG